MGSQTHCAPCFLPMSIVATRSPISGTAEHLHSLFWQPNRQAIIFCRRGLFCLPPFFLRLFSAVTGWLCTNTWCGLSANLEITIQVRNVLHAARWKYRTQKKSQSAHHHTNLLNYNFGIKACIDNRKKQLVKEQYLLHTSWQYGELRPLMAENGWRVRSSE